MSNNISVICLESQCVHDKCLMDNTLKNERFEKVFYKACEKNDTNTLKILHQLDPNVKPYMKRMHYICGKITGSQIPKCLEELWPDMKI